MIEIQPATTESELQNTTPELTLWSPSGMHILVPLTVFVYLSLFRCAMLVLSCSGERKNNCDGSTGQCHFGKFRWVWYYGVPRLQSKFEYIPGKYEMSSTEPESDSEILVVLNAIRVVHTPNFLCISFFHWITSSESKFLLPATQHLCIDPTQGEFPSKW